MLAKTPKNPAGRSELDASDIERAKGIARQLLGRLEQALGNVAPSNDVESEWQQKHHDRLFGNKSSLVSTLVSLSELMLKLNQFTTAPTQAEEMPGEIVRLSAADAALVDDFLRDAREQQTVDLGIHSR